MEKRKVKTIVALLLVLIMAVAMIGCAGNSNGTDSNSDTRISSQSGDTKKIAEEIQSKTDAERSEAGADTPPTKWRIARVRRCGLAAGSFIQDYVRLLEQMEQECRSGSSRKPENACGIRNNGRKAGRTDGAYRYRRD